MWMMSLSSMYLMYGVVSADKKQGSEGVVESRYLTLKG
jgi:hypothetical protein